MKLKTIFMAAALAIYAIVPVNAQQANKFQIKTHLDHLSGTPLILVINLVPSEITSITCDKWTMLGINSWKHQNEFPLPAAPVAGVSVGIMKTDGFDGYCKAHGSIIAHTDDGDFVGVLDRGDGNWTDSTKLTFSPK